MNRIKKIFIYTALVLFSLVFLTGCIKLKTVIKVKPDGSGTVEQTFLIQQEFVEMLRGLSKMGSGESGTEDSEEEFSLMDREKLESFAGQMGEGVSFLSADPLREGGFEGYLARYSFSDISKLRVNQNPGELVAQVPSEMPQEEQTRELVTFSFTRGNPSILKVYMPELKEEESEDGGSGTGEEDEPSVEDMEMLKQLYSTMLLRMWIEVEGDILNTNATYREGSQIILMEMDFGKIVEQEDKLEELLKNKTRSLEETKEMVRDIPGIRVELEDAVEIQFR